VVGSGRVEGGVDALVSLVKLVVDELAADEVVSRDREMEAPEREARASCWRA
jgi:hypothetical protein